MVDVLCWFVWQLEREVSVESLLAREPLGRCRQGEKEVQRRSLVEAPACPGWAPQGLAPAARQEGTL